MSVGLDSNRVKLKLSSVHIYLAQVRAQARES